MSTIQDINMAAGLKEALLKAGITLEQLIDCGAEEIALILGIEKYVATLIKQEAIKTGARISFFKSLNSKKYSRFSELFRN
jgi:hypothetical protein